MYRLFDEEWSLPITLPLLKWWFIVDGHGNVIGDGGGDGVEILSSCSSGCNSDFGPIIDNIIGNNINELMVTIKIDAPSTMKKYL